MMIRKTVIAGLVIVLSAGAGVEGKGTKIVVRAKAHDAKFIGTSVGGLKVVIKDAETGKLLDEGMIEGATGQTEAIMKEPVTRHKILADKQTAAFNAKVDVKEPTRVKIDLLGPAVGGGRVELTSKTLWVLPGHDIEGDGIVFDLYGLIVHLTVPVPNQVFSPEEIITIKAVVTMLCGCHVTMNGLWDANKYQVQAMIQNGEGKTVAKIPLYFGDKPSLFLAEFQAKDPGDYKVIVTAAQEDKHNYGVGVTGFTVKPAGSE